MRPAFKPAPIVLKLPDNYVPKEQWSPSGLSLAECEMAYFLRYVVGWREDDLVTWEEVADWKKPAPPKPDAPQIEKAEHRTKVDEWTRLTRRALGLAVHDVLYLHFAWQPPYALIDWLTRPATLALEGLDFVPDPSECAEIYPEQELEIQAGPDGDPIKIWGFADLVVRTKQYYALDVFHRAVRHNWILFDYKTTSSFDYVPLAAELVADVAANVYALALMVDLDLDVMPCRWIYFLTDDSKKASAQHVDFVIEREAAITLLEPQEALAARLREIMRVETAKKLGWAAPHHAKYSPVMNVHCCDKFRGCVYHAARGGPCKPPTMTLGQKIKHAADKDKKLGARREHQKSLRNAKKASRQA